MRSDYRAIVVVFLLILTIAAPVRARPDNQTATYPPITPANAEQVGEILQIGDGTIFEVAWSPDGQWVMVGSVDGILRYDARDGSRALLTGFKGQSDALAFSPDGKTFAATDRSQNLFRWTVADWKPTGRVTRFSTNEDFFTSALDYTPDGKRLLITGDLPGVGSVIQIRDAANLTLLNTISNEGHLFGASRVELNADETQAIVEGSGGRVWLFDLREKPPKPTRVLYAPQAEYGVTSAYTPDYRRVYAFGGDALRVWELGGRATIIRFTDDYAPYAGAIAPDKSRVVVAFRGNRGFEAAVYDLPNANFITRFAIPTQEVSNLLFNADGTRLLVVTPSAGLHIYETATGVIQTTIRHLALRDTTPAFSPDAKTLATATGTADILLWSIPDGASIGAMESSSGFIKGIQFSPDGKLLAASTFNRTNTGALEQNRITFFDTTTRELLRQTDIQLNEITSFRFADDGRTLFTADNDGHVHHWDVETGGLIGQYRYTSKVYIYPLFVSEGRFFHSSGTGVALASAIDKKTIREILLTEEGFNLIRASDQYIALRYDDADIGIFDLQGKAIARFDLERYPVTLEFAVDDALLISQDTQDGRALLFYDWKAKRLLRSRPSSGSLEYGGIGQSADGSLLAIGQQEGRVSIFAVK
jgi:WD40 repeat protein